MGVIDGRLVLNTGPRGTTAADTSSSLARLVDRVNELHDMPELIVHKTEIVIVGGWTFSLDTMEVLQAKYNKLDLENAVDTDVDEPMRTGDLTRARSQSSAAQSDTPRKHELEWALAVNLIKSVLEKIDGLKSLEWETDLPFSKEIWAVIPENIQKLSLNLFVPDVEELGEHDPHPDYFTHDDLMYLVNFKNLRSLRLYNMVESFQSIIWETVWKNTGLTTLELEMRDDPITRDGDNGGKRFPVIDDNWKYNTKRVAADKYRGRDGFGFLHHAYGYGEYLDCVAISKGRNAAMRSMGELNTLPLTTLRLGNFVVDDTSFAKYFDGLRKIVFTPKCADAGFVLPEKLNGKVNIFTRPTGMGKGGPSEVSVEMVSEAPA
ncbi:hypothetical protein DIS24_g9283 [Lasiodiplodia hormozganensis]|uniref:Uncharacterized protein n=1 Tax=Lasiodiplodia hormozganensis TaxID=869390 RepID=A0AA39XUH3_9PEZI|nr:hypothetical protein DIS24_g9283 [Lasiodiplodia hormozganensis]